MNYDALEGNMDGIEEFLEEFSSISAANTGMSAISDLIRIAIAILGIIGMWKMFDKAGENGWGALIPYYKDYLLFKIAEFKNWFWGYLIGQIVTTIAAIVFFIYIFVAIAAGFSGEYKDSYSLILGFSFIAMVGVGIFLFVVRIMRAIKITKAFNISGGYAVGIIFLPGIFYFVIGISKTMFHKNRPYYGRENAYAQGQNPYVQAQNPYAQNMYGQQDPYNQSQNMYGQQDPYAQNGYSQNTYTQNPYAQNPYAQSQDPYAQNTQQPYGSNPYGTYSQNPGDGGSDNGNNGGYGNGSGF